MARASPKRMYDPVPCLSHWEAYDFEEGAWWHDYFQ
jgi:hypothetical protein